MKWINKQKKKNLKRKIMKIDRNNSWMKKTCNSGNTPNK